jgi:hypothetical protein
MLCEDKKNHKKLSIIQNHKISQKNHEKRKHFQDPQNTQNFVEKPKNLVVSASW